MAFNIGPTLAVKGEAEFNKAMAEVRQEMKYVTAEANATMSAFGANEKSVASLTAKSNELSKALDIQNRAAADIRAAMQRLADAGISPTSEKFRGLKYNLDTVTESANKTEREIKDIQEELKNLKTYQAFDKELDSLRFSMEEVAAESEVIMSAFGRNEKSVESLTAKNIQLEKSLKIQRNSEDELREALVKLRADGVEPTDKKFRDLKIKFDNVTASANSTEREIKENNRAMADLNKTGVGLGDTIGGLASKLGISLPQGATESLNSMMTLDTQTLALAGGIVAAGAAVVKLTEALAELTIEQAALADDLLTNSMIWGMSTDAIQEMAYAADFVDVSVETMTGSMTKMIRSMTSARQGTGDAEEAFRRLHVRITDGNGQFRDSEEVFYDIIDALGKIGNETERDALSMQIFGKSARDLNPLIVSGTGALKGWMEEARKKYTLDEQELETLGKLDDSYMRYNAAIEKAKNTVAVEFAPALERLLDVGSDVFLSLGNFAEESGITEILGIMVDMVSSLAPALEIVLDMLGPVAGELLKPIALGLALIADALSIIVGLIGSAIEGVKVLLGLATSEKLDTYWKGVTRVFSDEGTTASVINNMIGNNANGTDNWRGGLTWVGERGPELVSLPSGSQVIPANRSAALAGGNFTMNVNSRDLTTVARMAATFESVRQKGRAK